MTEMMRSQTLVLVLVMVPPDGHRAAVEAIKPAGTITEI